jgi:hypothetical protein
MDNLMLTPDEDALLILAARSVSDRHMAKFFDEIAVQVRRGSNLKAAIDAALKRHEQGAFDSGD